MHLKHFVGSSLQQSFAKKHSEFTHVTGHWHSYRLLKAALQNEPDYPHDGYQVLSMYVLLHHQLFKISHYKYRVYMAPPIA